MPRKNSIVPPDIGEEESSAQEESSGYSDSKEQRSINAPPEIRMAIERVKAQVNALSEVREATNERLLRISEQIGEIRNMVVENEKNMKDIEVKAMMASDMVREVRPERFSQQITKLDTKSETLKARIDAVMSLNENIVEELKNIKRQMGLFKGTDAIFKLNDEIRKELIDIQKIKSMVDGHANKVEQIFIDVQKNFRDFKKVENDAQNAISISSDLQKDVTSIKIRLQAMPARDDLEMLRKDMHAQFSRENEIMNKNLWGVYNFAEKLAEKVRKNLSGELKSNPYADHELAQIKQQLLEHKRWMGEIITLIELVEKKTGKKTDKNIEEFMKHFNGLKRALKINDINGAKKIYFSAVDSYSLLEEKEKAKVYKELTQLYNRINGGN